MFEKLKFWLAIAGGVVFAMGALLLRSFHLGRSVEKAQGIEDAAQAKEKHDVVVNDAIQAGDAARTDAADPERLRVDDGYKRKRTTKRKPTDSGV